MNDLTPEQQIFAAKHGSDELHKRLIDSEKTHPDTIKEIAKNRLASHENIESIYQKHKDNPDSKHIISAVLSHPNVKQKHLIENHDKDEHKNVIARNPRTPSKVLEVMAKKGYVPHKTIAANPNINHDTFNHIMQHGNQEDRNALMQHHGEKASHDDIHKYLGIS